MRQTIVAGSVLLCLLSSGCKVSGISAAEQHPDASAQAQLDAGADAGEQAERTELEPNSASLSAGTTRSASPRFQLSGAITTTGMQNAGGSSANYRLQTR